jgi:hypothetical protein
MRLRPNESEPTHLREILVISRTLAAARMHLSGTKPPLEDWKLTGELIEEAERALNEIGACRKRVLFVR